MFYKKIYITSLLISNNIFYNFYLLFNIFFPKYFKDKMIKTKELNDEYYNNLLFLIYTEEIYEKYDIDIIKIKNMYYEFIEKYNKKNLIMNNDNVDKTDNISNISSITSSLNSSPCSSLNSSFYGEIEVEQ